MEHHETLKRLAEVLDNYTDDDSNTVLKGIVKLLGNGMLKRMSHTGDEFARAELQHRAEKRTQRRAAR